MSNTQDTHAQASRSGTDERQQQSSNAEPTNTRLPTVVPNSALRPMARSEVSVHPCGWNPPCEYVFGRTPAHAVLEPSATPGSKGDQTARNQKRKTKPSWERTTRRTQPASVLQTHASPDERTQQSGEPTQAGNTARQQSGRKNRTGDAGPRVANRHSIQQNGAKPGRKRDGIGLPVRVGAPARTSTCIESAEARTATGRDVHVGCTRHHASSHSSAPQSTPEAAAAASASNTDTKGWTSRSRRCRW